MAFNGSAVAGSLPMALNDSSPPHIIIAVAVRLETTRRFLIAAVEALPATATLTLIAGLNLLIYLLAFVAPYHLLSLYDRPLTDLAHLTHRTPSALLPMLGTFILLALLYWVAWRVAGQARGQTAWAIVWGGMVTASIALLFLYPYDAADVFDNIMHGRILGIYGANPFHDRARLFPDDPFLPYVAWQGTPSAYGPLWELLAAGVARLAGDGIMANVIAFKLVGVLFLGATMALVGAIVHRTHPDHALRGVLLLGWNPVALMEVAGQGHNDSVMAFWLVAAIGAVATRHYTLAVGALIVGTLVKFIPILLLPAVVVVALRSLSGWRRRFGFLLAGGVLTVVVVVAAYAPFWEGTETLGVGRRTRMFTTSLPAMVYVSIQPTIDKATAGKWVSAAAAGLTALVAMGVCWRLWHRPDWQRLTESAAWVLLFYLLFACSWFQSWYVVWLLPLAALLPPGNTARLIVLFGFAALSKILVAGPLLLWIRPLPPQWWRELRLAPAVHWLPWLYVAGIGGWRLAQSVTSPKIKSRIDAESREVPPYVENEAGR
jgi:alpha-1,6-mannosyltransferase